MIKKLKISFCELVCHITGVQAKECGLRRVLVAATPE
jgi:hypothetical protein